MSCALYFVKGIPQMSDTTMNKTPPSHPSTASATQPTQVTYLVGELVCHLCGTTAGTIQSEHRPLPRTVRFTAAGSDKSVLVLDWRRLRCARCGGALFVEDLETVRQRIEPKNIWDDERPRRGRPPKWLVEQRKREREEFERLTQAA